MIYVRTFCRSIAYMGKIWIGTFANFRILYRGNHLCSKLPMHVQSSPLLVILSHSTRKVVLYELNTLSNVNY